MKMTSEETTCADMDLLRCLEPDLAAQRHLEGCYLCQEQAQEAARVRGWAASQPAEGWAGAPPPEVEVEAALAAVLAQGRPGGLAPVLTRLAAVAAAALLVVGLTGPTLLRLRLRGFREAPPTAQLGITGQGPGQIVFWTVAR